MSYSNKERYIANLLTGNPIMKNAIKWTYSFINSLINKSASKEILDSAVNITDISPNNSDSTFWGYYDKPCSNSNDVTLFHQTVGNPYKKNKGVNIFLKDSSGGVKKIATSKAWNWQQGAMLTWVDNSTFIFNDFNGKKYVSYLFDINGRLLKALDYPIYSVRNHKALTVSFIRLAKLRPDYGYFNLPTDDLKSKPDNEGIAMLDLSTGEYSLIISLKELAEFKPQSTMLSACHKANHVQFSPNGEKFNFLHRWYDGSKKYTRLMTANIDGSNLQEIIADGMVSHCNWLDNQNIICWARKNGVGDRYFLFNIQNHHFSIVGDGQLKEDGHPSVLNSRWLLTDTYPDRSRMAHLILFDIQTNKKITLGKFHSSMRFWAVNRCDLHPRWNPDGKSITFDSVHSGTRRLYHMDLSSILNK
jgi:hypothetical protein